MMEEITPKYQIKSHNSYITTSELAKFCGVSRFTVINWVNQGKIKTIKTAGGHRRIPFSEVLFFLETLHIDKEKKSVLSEPLAHCWEYVEKTRCEKKCRNCLIYKRNIDYCFLVVRQFGKEMIRCQGNCLDCDYFNEFFNKRMKAGKWSDKKTNLSLGSQSMANEVKDIDMSKEIIEEKKNFLYSFSHNLGLGMRGLKKRIVNLKKRFMNRGLTAKEDHDSR